MTNYEPPDRITLSTGDIAFDGGGLMEGCDIWDHSDVKKRLEDFINEEKDEDLYDSYLLIRRDFPVGRHADSLDELAEARVQYEQGPSNDFEENWKWLEEALDEVKPRMTAKKDTRYQCRL